MSKDAFLRSIANHLPFTAQVVANSHEAMMRMKREIMPGENGFVGDFFPVFVIADWNLAKLILADTENYPRHPLQQGAGVIMGPLVTEEGESYLHSRRTVNRSGALKSEAIARYTSSMIEQIDSVVDTIIPGQEFDAKDFSHQVMVKVAPLILANGEPFPDGLAEELVELMHGVTDFKKLLFSKEYRDLNTRIDKRLEKFIEDNKDKDLGLITELTKEYPLPKAIALIKGFMSAALDTTETVLTWLFKHLAEQPEIFNQIREEVGSTFNPEKWTLCMQAVTESTRLHPPAPYSFRFANKTEKLGEDTVPFWTTVLVVAEIFLKDPEAFGEDAEEFNPHRFDNDPEMLKIAQLAWNYGAHFCPGQGASYAEAMLTVARFMKRFKSLRLTDPNQHYEPTFTSAQVAPSVKMIAEAA